jgi:hypothetical protein
MHTNSQSYLYPPGQVDPEETEPLAFVINSLPAPKKTNLRVRVASAL